MAWSPVHLVPIVVPLAFALFRRFAPFRQEKVDWREQQVPQPYEPGVIGGLMCAVGIALGLSFFLFRWANHAWAGMDHDAILRFYPTPVLWCFFPGFAALSVPWPFTVWSLRRQGRSDEARSIVEESSGKTGFDSYRVMKWFSYWLVTPIGLATLLAVPIHMSIARGAVRRGHFGSVAEEVFPLADARAAYLIDGVAYGNGSFHQQSDLYLVFADGRQLRANEVGDGGTSADPRAVKLLLELTGLTPSNVHTPDEIARK